MTVTATKPPTNGTQAVEATPASLLREFYWEPFPTFVGMQRMMESMFDYMLPLRGTEPAIDVYEKDGVYTIACAVPGFTKDRISIDAKDHEVTISGTYKEEHVDEKTRFYKRQLRRGSFSRTVTFAQEIDPNKVSATLENGVLKVTAVPVAPMASKKVPISAN